LHIFKGVRELKVRHDSTKQLFHWVITHALIIFKGVRENASLSYSIMAISCSLCFEFLLFF